MTGMNCYNKCHKYAIFDILVTQKDIDTACKRVLSALVESQIQKESFPDN